jgi:hypothetical protein
VRKVALLVFSYAFYAAWDPPFVVLLVASTIVDWFVAKAMAASEAPARRKALLATSLVFNLGLLVCCSRCSRASIAPSSSSSSRASWIDASQLLGDCSRRRRCVGLRSRQQQQ